MSEGGLEVERQRGTNFIYFPTALRTGQGTTSGNFRKMKKYIKSITLQPQNLLGKYSEMPKHEKKSEAIYNNLLGLYFFFPAFNLSKTSK